MHGFLQQRAQLAKLGDLGGSVQAVNGFDEQVTEGSAGRRGMALKGVPLQADAVVDIEGDCPGWREVPSENALELTIVIEDGKLVPVAWGRLRDCRLIPEKPASLSEFDLEPVPDGANVVFDADLVALMADVLKVGRSSAVLVIEYRVTRFEADGVLEPGWTGDLRVVGKRLEFLVQAEAKHTLVVFESSNSDVLRVRAKNGNWVCNPQRRKCARSDEPGESFRF
jgi:hypothetical protein